MLHTSAIEPDTLSVLKRLMKLPELNQFSLVGGTALALKFGHRISVDLDLFSSQKINQEEIEKVLQNEFAENFIYEKTKITFAVFCRVHNIKVDIVRHPHPLIRKIEFSDGIRIFSNEDIAATKINAILGRGEKKDFYDLAELLKHYSLKQIMEWHKEKFPSQMLLISIPEALCYFNDADQSQQPKMLNNQSWKNVKKQIQKAVRDFLK